MLLKGDTQMKLLLSTPLSLPESLLSPPPRPQATDTRILLESIVDRRAGRSITRSCFRDRVRADVEVRCGVDGGREGGREGRARGHQPPSHALRTAEHSPQMVMAPLRPPFLLLLLLSSLMHPPPPLPSSAADHVPQAGSWAHVPRALQHHAPQHRRAHHRARHPAADGAGGRKRAGERGKVQAGG